MTQAHGRGDGEGTPVDEKMRQEITLHRRAVIAEAASARLASGDRGAPGERQRAGQHSGPGDWARSQGIDVTTAAGYQPS